ncbi:asparaginase [Telmatospirillum siberiense]|uniref:L-asparaginase II n=1 Tax=Telmatospirillum siberiense TaxID=382514 RepID=A0A2N3PY07_9PROT|nr:asparaginase [Telmatospirillum siberiense]PKU25294.1 L-asparaginase II [Telmatospirillum siberiense]
MTRKPRPPVHHPDPVLVEATRGPLVESLHRGAVAVCDAAGEILAGWGDIERAVFPRSAVKPLQALPLIETGAAERFALSDQEIALACASHAGNALQVELVEKWLLRIGLTETDLECGPQIPSDADTARALLCADKAPSALHNNCSGKHCGMLTTARHLNEPTKGYVGADHPVQLRITAVLGEMTGTVPQHTPFGTDGCGIPTYALPLSGLATAMARLADPSRQGPTRRKAAARILAAMSAHPELIAGKGRLSTEVMRAVPSVMIKGGAEGVYTAILPGKGLGVAVKIDDGANRAAEVALLAVLRHLQAFTTEEEAALADHLQPILRNAAGQAIGVLRPAPDWLG